MNGTAFKILTAEQWNRFAADGVFAGAPIDLADGYIHLSTAEQLQGTLEKHFSGQADLVIAEVALDRLGETVRWEAARGGALFPHIYGVLPMTAVLRVEQQSSGGAEPALYDRIGVNYAALRVADPRIAAMIEAALGPAQSVLNVGAGTGNYEPGGRSVTAVEPSPEMIRKRAPHSAPAIQAQAENLPFEADAFDAAMAILTVHHWPDKAKGLQEMRRVTRGPIVLLTFDPAARPWLTDYLPGLAALDDEKFPRISDYEKWLGPVRSIPVPVPHDCTDGFLYAYWRRPDAYLDPRIRSGMSSFWADAEMAAGLQKLEDDLSRGEWNRRYGHLLALDDYDAGYRLIVTC